MEFEFENEYVWDHKTVQEIYWHLFFGEPLLIVGYALLALCFIGGLLMCAAGEDMLYVVILVPVVFLIQFYRYRSSVSVTRKREEEICGGQPVNVRMGINGRAVSSQSNDRTPTTIPLSKIKKAVLTKHTITLITDGRQLCVFRKDSFTVGTPEQFVVFLQEHHILH